MKLFLRESRLEDDRGIPNRTELVSSLGIAVVFAAAGGFEGGAMISAIRDSLSVTQGLESFGPMLTVTIATAGGASESFWRGVAKRQQAKAARRPR